ncbi:unnamed protein product, partial [Closterium sp. NIES-53]
TAGAGGARAAGTGGVGTAGAGGTGARAAGAGGSGAAGAGGAGVASAGGARATGAGGASVGGAGVGGAGGARAGGAGGARATKDGSARVGGAGGARVGGAGGAGAAGAGGAGAGGTGHAGARATVPRRPFFYPLPQSSLPPPDSALHQLLPGSPLPAPAPHAEVTESLTERHEPQTRASTPVRARRVPRPRPPAVLGIHVMELRPSSVPQRVALPSPPASSLPDVPDPESDLARAISPTITLLLATVITNPDIESTAAFSLVTELVDFAGRSRLYYVASLVTESESVCPPSVRGELALGCDILEDKQFELNYLTAALPRIASILLCPERDPDALDIPTPRSYREVITGTYVDEVPPPGANIVNDMWIFRVKWPPGSPPAFKARYVARGFSQRQGVDFFHTFSPTPKMTTLRVLLHVAAQHDYELHSLDISIAFLQGSLHEKIWLRRPPGFTGSFPEGTQWSLRRPVYGLCQAPREWHDTLRTTLAALGFSPSTADPSLFLRTDPTLPPFYILVYIDDLVFATADTKALTLVKAELQKSFSASAFGSPCHSPLLCLQATHSQFHLWTSPTSGMELVLGGPGPVVLTRHANSSGLDDQATRRLFQGYSFTLGSGSVCWRSTGSSSVLGSSCMAEIYAGAMAAQELRWLTYLLTDLRERPRSPQILYVDNKAMIALCQEHRLEHRTKHIALRYFLARELQQRG